MRYVHDLIQLTSNELDTKKAYQFTEYSPMVFEHIRRLMGIST